MTQFDLTRFGRLAKWSLTFDKGYYLKTFLQALVVATLLFVGFTTRFFTFRVNGTNENLGPCALVFIVVLMVDVIIGPALMLYSFKNKHDDVAYMMLPASNLEKYLMRYVTWIILLPIQMVALMAADLLQYLVNLVMDSGHPMLIMPYLIDKIQQIIMTLSYVSSREINSVLFSILSVHAFYALGGTFFRSHKAAWVLTTLVIIINSILLALVLPQNDSNHMPTTFDIVFIDALYVAWTILCFWLSYKFFCRQQVIGKFINL